MKEYPWEKSFRKTLWENPFQNETSFSEGPIHKQATVNVTHEYVIFF